jgi:hypothetical protein
MKVKLIDAQIMDVTPDIILSAKYPQLQSSLKFIC